MRDEQTTPKKSTALIFLACLLLFGIPAGACIYLGDLATGIALAAVGVSCYLGYLTGAVRALASVAGIVAAGYFGTRWIGDLRCRSSNRKFGPPAVPAKKWQWCGERT